MSRAWLNGVLGVLAVVLVSVAVWQWNQQQVPPVQAPQRSDYILRDYELTTLDQAGRESFTVRGPYLQRDVGGKSLSLVEPRFSFPAAQGGRWQARSEAAWVSPDADQVHLLRAVEMVGPPSETGQRVRFATERLRVLPDVDRADAAGQVTVTHGDSILVGTGLDVDMPSKRFQLQNDVKGHYAPRRN
ncbi:MAG TPA: LPS export ABC transporter periplasmic protein LptC [Arenimonas sp.]|uniref:LPS export ABC transporter periplasmic protein LptC n=1 Tax=Arenimonas sp. TaxID=1872635 RepID=UPI002D7FA907|nr:LPS export ABC transporter periplasmic protein LptC [Arenimonas sp.]HEU0152028.1 LPS export ABC transporter periplasmic protein LptC [Arenimonas sp.]